MPLQQSASNEALQENIKTEIAHGKSPEQAAAIAYSTQRANDQEYVPSVVECVPESVSLAEINNRNHEFYARRDRKE